MRIFEAAYVIIGPTTGAASTIINTLSVRFGTHGVACMKGVIATTDVRLAGLTDARAHLWAVEVRRLRVQPVQDPRITTDVDEDEDWAQINCTVS